MVFGSSELPLLLGVCFSGWPCLFPFFAFLFVPPFQSLSYAFHELLVQNLTLLNLLRSSCDGGSCVGGRGVQVWWPDWMVGGKFIEAEVNLLLISLLTVLHKLEKNKIRDERTPMSALVIANE
jgi:hypothetical protein